MKDKYRVVLMCVTADFGDKYRSEAGRKTLFEFDTEDKQAAITLFKEFSEEVDDMAGLVDVEASLSDIQTRSTIKSRIGWDAGRGTYKDKNPDDECDEEF